MIETVFFFYSKAPLIFFPFMLHFFRQK